MRSGSASGTNARSREQPRLDVPVDRRLLVKKEGGTRRPQSDGRSYAPDPGGRVFGFPAHTAGRVSTYRAGDGSDRCPRAPRATWNDQSACDTQEALGHRDADEVVARLVSRGSSLGPAPRHV